MKKKIDLSQLMKKEKKSEKKIEEKTKNIRADIVQKEKTEEVKEKIISAPEDRKIQEPISEEKHDQSPPPQAPILAQQKRIINQEVVEETEDDGKEYVSFMLGREEYGMDSDYVRQIIKYKRPIDIGIKSDILHGVINVKDSILPIIDFRKKFRLEEKISLDGSIIILQVNGIRIGVYVDYLVGISRLNREDIKKIPPFLPEHLLKYIQGIGIKKDGGILIILDHKNLFSKEELNELKAIPEFYK